MSFPSQAGAQDFPDQEPPKASTESGTEAGIEPGDVRQPSQRERIYFPHLDGLRFWAFFAVFLSHSLNLTNAALLQSASYGTLLSWFKVGVLGVNFFFVLSGFLITYLLLAERQQIGRIDVRSFYVRRALRIWPLYFAIVALVYAVRPGFPAGAIMPSIGYYLAFAGNFDLIHSALLPAHLQPTAGQLTVLWSVGIEEQFYLVWPLLMSAAPPLAARLGLANRGGNSLGAPLMCGAVCALSLGFRIAVRHSHDELYWNTLAVIGDMALGGLVAWKCFEDGAWTRRIAGLSRPAIVAGYIVMLAVAFAFASSGPTSWARVLGRPLVAAAFAFVILEQCYATNSFYKCGRSRWLSKLGTYTYGLYCLHELAITAVQKVMLKAGADRYWWQILAIHIPASLGLSIAAAALSYSFLERPFLRLKRRFAHVRTT